MGRTNIPDDFDFLDADRILKDGLPVSELAELRRSEPIHWVDVPGGTGGFGGTPAQAGFSSPGTPTSRRCRDAATSFPARSTARSRCGRRR